MAGIIGIMYVVFRCRNETTRIEFVLVDFVLLGNLVARECANHSRNYMVESKK